MKTKLTKEEKEILDSFEKDEWVPVTNLTKREKGSIAYARNTLRKDKRLNIWISEIDLLELQKRQSMKDCPIRLMYPALSTNSLTEIWLKRENRPANKSLQPIAAR